MSDLNEIFSRLKSQQQSHLLEEESRQAASQAKTSSFWETDALRQASVSSPIFSPPIQTPNPRHASNIMSPASRQSPLPTASSTDQNMSVNLLNLLNINRAQPSSQPSASPLPSQIPQRPNLSSSRTASNPTGGENASETGPPAHTQRYLLDLLTNASKPGSLPKPESSPSLDMTNVDETSINKLAQSFATKSSEQMKRDSTPSRQSTPVRQSTPALQFGSPSASSAKFEAPTASKAGLFNYINPFDQLHASSPLNSSSKPELGESTPSNGDLPPNSKSRKIASPENKGTNEYAERPQMSVAEKLEGVGERVDREVEQALAQVTVKGEQATGDVESNWSTAEDEDARQEEEAKVEVYNFPMKPFVTLQLQPNHISRSFKASTWESATPVARLKKEFSHDDRTLATASQSHIVYAVVPTEKKPASGLKIIRQDDGKNKHIWAKTGERLCNVQVSSGQDDDVEVILATGINGTIFYTTLTRSRGDVFDDDDVEAQGFVMPPPPNSDEPNSTSGFGTSSAIKTRAKLSNRHSADYFAVARGRQIYLISPKVVKAHTAKSNRVNTESYLAVQNLSINTGKAGKDFCFSEDDTVIVSLDKLGTVKFWDIRPLTSALNDSPTKTESPLHSFTAGAVPARSDDKMSPSSIMFLDKDRAFSKAVALRYLLIGYQQNHLLQLWDLGLGKCVQELRFPESVSGKDGSNPMCSVTYHPKTGIICLGHPGRNSVYFIHLSAPKYNVPQMDQATYLASLASGDTKAVPRPESTAIMSGIREFSCSRVGELRSLDVLRTPFPTPSIETNESGEGETIFELYLMHSKGVLGLPINRADLGWDAKGKLVKPADAVEKGVVIISDLNLPSPGDKTKERATEGPTKPVVKMNKIDGDGKNVGKPETKRESTRAVPPPETLNVTSNAPSVDNRNVEAASKVQTKAVEPSQPVSKASASTPKQTVSTPLDVADTTATSRVPLAVSNGVIKSIEPAPTTLEPAASEPREDVMDLLTNQFASLYSKIDSDKRVTEAANAAKQDAVLRLVSSTLTENVESSLQRIVSTSIEQHVLPALTNKLLSTVERSTSQGLKSLVPDTVKAALPNTIKEALKDPSVLRTLSQDVAKDVTQKVNSEVVKAVQSSLTVMQSSLTSQFAELKGLHSEWEGKSSAREKEFEVRIANTQRDTLTALQESEQRISRMLTELREEQARLAAGVTSLQQQGQPSQGPSSGAVPTEPQDEPSEVERLTEMLNQGNFEQATIEWLQSAGQAELFDDLFVRINPAYLQQVSPLVALSVSAAVTASFDSNVEKRLEWLSSVIGDMDANDPEIHDVAPKIMDVLIQRLQGAYMQIAEARPTDPVLRRLVALNKRIGEVRRVLG